MVNDEDALAELEQELFGMQGSRSNNGVSDHYIGPDDFVPFKTGVDDLKMLKAGPKHILEAENYEPLYIHQAYILESCLRREAQRVAHAENLMNRIVYDSQKQSQQEAAAPKNPAAAAGKDAASAAAPAKDKSDASKPAQAQPSAVQQEPENVASGDNPLNLPTAANCDNSEAFEEYYTPTSPTDFTLQFESRFESGNLRRAVQVYVFEYDLIIQPDYLTKSNSQWFYFRLRNTRANKTYRFNIINLLKPDSLYNHGMQPLMYSEKDAATKGIGWQRAGRDVCYY